VDRFLDSLSWSVEEVTLADSFARLPAMLVDGTFYRNTGIGQLIPAS